MSKEFTRQEVSEHSKAGDAWIVIDTIVYDISKFAVAHPGGELLILEYAGKDATEPFYAYHRQEVLHGKYSKFQIGKIVNESRKIDWQQPGDLSKVPYGEASAFQGFHSPYYNESHHRFRKAVRTFVQSELAEEAAAFDELGKGPSVEAYKKMGAFGLLACRIGQGPHLKNFKLPGGVKHEEFDYFHELIAHEEITILGYGSYQDGLSTGFIVGLPPVMKFCKSKALRDRVVREVLAGEKRICLAITEPSVGSDVANLSTRAELSADGKHYIVNGAKKWITNGLDSQYFTTAVRTGKGHGGITMLLIERGPGVETKPVRTSYSSSAGTSYVTFENVKVPVENMLGEEGQGFLVIMFNFNHERWYLIASNQFGCRKAVEECFKWANQRKVFGKRLIEQPVIRQKLAHMVSQVEGVQCWLEHLTYQMCKMPYQEAVVKLGGPLALLKLRSTRTTHNVADDACQIFGGRAITRTGMGNADRRNRRPQH
ncbi:hypothetical protein HDU91_000045 [Kappamyces sp. JEL0680]|nr:hypothetical protein HDU91_000045 [Kappamyces sp. JEL0680]